MGMNPYQLLEARSYVLNPYFIPPAIAAALVSALAIFIWSLERKSRFNRSIIYLCVSSAVWLLSNSLIYCARTEEIAVFWVRFFYLGFVLMPVTIFHITVAYTKQYLKEKRFVVFGYVAAVVFIILIGQDIFSIGVRKYFFGFYPDIGAIKLLFLFFMLFFPFLGLVNLATYFRRVKDAFERKRTKHLIIAFVLVTFSYFDILPSLGIEVYPFGYLAILCFLLSMAYSIIKYHNLVVEHHAEELQREVQEKKAEISHVSGELRTTQVKLMETGKISALASLSAGILHQISQPITAIHGFVRFIKKEMPPTDPFYKAITLMEEQSVYLKDMLEDLMELIRHREIKKEDIDVNVCLRKAANLLTDELRIRRINWELVLEERLPFVHADAIHLQQIFMNIMVNAMEALFTLPKGAKRFIKINSRFDKILNKIVISFEDTGPGISPEAREQIFEPFFSTKTKGSGIGLALCKDLIAEHGGEIDIENSTVGTIFIVKLPYVHSP